MKLIPNWRRCWRMFSVQALAIVGVLQATLAVVPLERSLQPVPLLSAWPATAGTTWADCAFYLSLVVAALGAVGRLIDQGPVTETTP